MIIKVCGMRDSENIRQVAELGADWLGFIFWPGSARFVTMVPTNAGIIPDRSNLDLLSSGATPKRVGVFVDEMAQNIITRVVNFQLDLVQFHGHETPTLIRNLRRTLDPDIRPGIQFIKAIAVSSRDDVATYKDYEDCVDYFLFDTRKPAEPDGNQLPGGTGQQFDWSVLDAYDGTRPFLLSGGIGPDDAPRLKEWFATGSHPAAEKCIGIDLNSRFETEPGVKDIARLRAFLEQLRSG